MGPLAIQLLGGFMEEVKHGDRVCLNVSKRLYYFQSEGGINLTENESIAVIPDTATDEHLKQINHALKLGHLTTSWPEEKIVVPDKDGDLKIILESGRNKINDWVWTLRDDKNISREVKIAKIEKIIEFEKAGKNRKSVLLAAEKSLEYIGGVSRVVDSDQEKVEIKLTSGTEEPKIE
jgi:hypothetical protein